MRKHVLGTLAATTGLAVLGLTVGVGAPAYATEECRTSKKSIGLPGGWPSVDFKIKLCIERTSSGGHNAIAHASWYRTATPPRAFDMMRINLRVERYDRWAGATTEYVTSDVNHYPVGSWSAVANSTSRTVGGWSADATVTYNVNNDGKGDKTWEVYGSPLIR